MNNDTNSTAILVKDLVKKFGDFTAVNKINFTVNRGEIFGFLGPNGSGKTTTIRMMLGLLLPTSGYAEILNIPVAREPMKIRPNIGYMSQRFSLYNDLTVEQNLNFYGKAYGLHNQALKERIRYALEYAGLEGHERTKTRDLSGGWRQRLALGAAILHQPKVLFLDEPTAGVDPISRRLFWELLYQLAAAGTTIFVTTHYMDEAEHCHRLAFIQRGKIIASGSPESIKHETIQNRIIEIACDRLEQAYTLLESYQETNTMPLQNISIYGATIHAAIPADSHLTEEIRAALEDNGITINNIHEIEPTLEDVFITRMQRVPGGS